jgi:proteasome accessory factor C
VELDGNRARVLLRYADPAWLVRLVLGLGGGARLLEPPELVHAVGRRAREALAVAEAGGVGQAGEQSGNEGGEPNDG